MAGYEEGLAIMLGVYFISILVLAITWSFQLFGENKQDKNSIIKVGLVLFYLWVMPLFIQLMIQIATDNTASTPVINLLTALYEGNMWMVYTITAILFIFFLLNLLMWFGVDVAGSFRGKKKGGKNEK